MPTDHQTEEQARSADTASIGTLALLMALTALGQLATNVVIPSLHDIAGTVGLPAESVGLVMAMVLLGLAIGQLVVGPLSDRIGRRPVLIGGLTIYLLGSICATFATSGTVLLLARMVQGLGASAGLALPRAIARDRFAGPEFMRTMSLLTMAMAVTPGLAPVLGGLIADSYGWRVSLSTSILAGALALAACLLSLRETHHDRAAPGGILSVIAAYGHILGNRSFLAYAVISGAAIGGAYAEVSGAQQFYTGEFGWPASKLSLATACYAGAAFSGSVLSGYIHAAFRLRFGISLMVLSPLVLLGLHAAGVSHPGVMVGLVVLSQIGLGIMIGMAIGAALMAVERSAGTASAVLGAIHMAMGAGGAAIVSAMPTAVGVSIPLVMVSFAILAMILSLTVRRAYR